MEAKYTVLTKTLEAREIDIRTLKEQIAQSEIGLDAQKREVQGLKMLLKT